MTQKWMNMFGVKREELENVEGIGKTVKDDDKQRDKIGKYKERKEERQKKKGRKNNSKEGDDEKAR